jgi:type VI secretion system secreted protein Hcp
MPGGGVGTFFLKLDGIAGESTDLKHKEAIELVSFNWGLEGSAAGASGGGGGAGKVQLKEFEFLMRVNKASPALFLAAASGKHLKDATLSVSRGTKAAFEWLKVKFTDVLITSYEQLGDDEGLHEVVAFDFAKVELQVTPQSTRGGAGATVSAGWDLTKNVKL